MHEKPQFEFSSVHCWDSQHVGTCNVAITGSSCCKECVSCGPLVAVPSGIWCSVTAALPHPHYSSLGFSLLAEHCTHAQCGVLKQAVSEPHCHQDFLRLHGRLGLPLPSFPSSAFLKGANTALRSEALHLFWTPHPWILHRSSPTPPRKTA